MHARTIHVLFGSQSICFTTHPPVLVIVHNTKHNFYVKYMILYYRLASVIDKEKLKMQGPYLKTMKVKEPLELVGMDLIGKLN